jgi:hypothetical protein
MSSTFDVPSFVVGTLYRNSRSDTRASNLALKREAAAHSQPSTAQARPYRVLEVCFQLGINTQRSRLRHRPLGLIWLESAINIAPHHCPTTLYGDCPVSNITQSTRRLPVTSNSPLKIKDRQLPGAKFIISGLVPRRWRIFTADVILEVVRIQLSLPQSYIAALRQAVTGPTVVCLALNERLGFIACLSHLCLDHRTAAAWMLMTHSSFMSAAGPNAVGAKEVAHGCQARELVDVVNNFEMGACGLRAEPYPSLPPSRQNRVGKTPGIYPGAVKLAPFS